MGVDRDRLSTTVTTRAGPAGSAFFMRARRAGWRLFREREDADLALPRYAPELVTPPAAPGAAQDAITTGGAPGKRGGRSRPIGRLGRPFSLLMQRFCQALETA
jgi:hypothetical protein